MKRRNFCDSVHTGKLVLLEATGDLGIRSHHMQCLVSPGGNNGDAQFVGEILDGIQRGPLVSRAARERAPEKRPEENNEHIAAEKLLAGHVRNFLKQADHSVSHNQSLDLIAALPGR